MTQRLRRRLNRFHVWLGWLVAVPLLAWTISGLFMASFPIEQIRGAHLRREMPPLDRAVLVPPQPGNRPVSSLTAEQQASGPRWVIAYADGSFARADGRTGKRVAAVDRREALAIARAAYAGKQAVQSVTFFATDANPLDLRRARPAWQVRHADGTNFYIDSESGRLLAVRSSLWRVYDLMWGLHILDLQDREDSHHPLLYGLAAIAAAAVLFGTILLPLTLRRRRRMKS
ncbi:hypothetical protein SLG_00760 [Sphingobium sp. SYK-6]|uniref:hypothetical protein n=1 Tax=Sphingobium sp. (strain NBRC 103272 / SYK-6) TaxID=627192 RepID=UPI0002276A17|nr:hypothetical protein [Sphingobium sp. SYK-6]BAK64751.1 hypothetical protein SLG_00760 [Sphingobium sp. SYK-6]